MTEKQYYGYYVVAWDVAGKIWDRALIRATGASAAKTIAEQDFIGTDHPWHRWEEPDMTVWMALTGADTGDEYVTMTLFRQGGLFPQDIENAFAASINTL